MHTPEEILKIMQASLNAAWNNYIGKLAPLNLPPEIVECMKLTYFDAYKAGTEFAARPNRCLGGQTKIIPKYLCHQNLITLTPLLLKS